MAKKEPWFGKRWTKSVVGGADAAIFNRNKDENFVSMGSSFCINFTLGLVAGVVYAIVNFFDDAESLTTITSNVAAVLSILLSAYFLYKTLGQIPSIGMRVARTLFVLVLNLLGMLAGLFIGMWVTFIVIGAVLIYFVLKFCTNEFIAQGKRDNTSKGVSQIILSDGEIINSGVSGETYTDSVGRRYKYRNGEFFRE